jgi:tetratricopeptide (TPR) repeat protein
VSQLRVLVAEFPANPDFKLELAEAICGSSASQARLGSNFDASGSEQVTARQGFEEAMDILDGLRRSSPINGTYALALAEAHRTVLSNRLYSPGETIRRLTNARKVLEPFVLSTGATIEQKDTYASILGMLGQTCCHANKWKDGKQAYDQAIQLLRELVKLDPASAARRRSLLVTLGNSTQFFQPRGDELLARRKEELALAESLVRDFPSIPKYRHDLGIALNNAGAAYINRTDKDPDTAMLYFDKAKQVFDELCRDYPTSKKYSDALKDAHVQRLNFQGSSHSNDLWLTYAEEYRSFLRDRAERFNDTRSLGYVAELGWHVASLLVEKGNTDDAVKWAADACAELKDYFDACNRQPELLVGQMETTRQFFLELHRAGLRGEAARIQKDLSDVMSVLNHGQRGDFCAGILGKYPEAAEHYHEHLRKDYSHFTAYSIAILLLQTGDQAGYETISRQMLERSASKSDDLNAQWQTLSACLLSPQPVADSNELLRLANGLVTSSTVQPSPVRHGRGLAAYRTGDWEGALQWCAESRELIPPYHIHDQLPPNDASYALNFIVEAMALHQLGRTDEAKTAYDAAIKKMQKVYPLVETGHVGLGKDWRTWEYLELLRREAAALLQIPTTNDPQSISESTPSVEANN